MKRCARCGDTKPLTEFYKRGAGSHSWCKACSIFAAKQFYKSNTAHAISLNATRKKNYHKNNYANLEELFGPLCSECGSLFPMEIFEYHHPDPSTKEGRLRLDSWTWKRVQAYVIKTVQLCPNCHRIKHYLLRKENIE